MAIDNALIAVFRFSISAVFRFSISANAIISTDIKNEIFVNKCRINIMQSVQPAWVLRT